MHARVSTFKGGSESVDRALAQADEVAPVVRGMAGSRGLIFLADRESGDTMSITLWEDADALRESEQAADRLRRDLSEAAGEEIVSVDRYEVIHFDVGDAS